MKLIFLVVFFMMMSVEGFSITLDEVNKQMLRTNPLIKEQIEYYNAVRKDLEISKSGYRPTLDVVASVGREHTDSIAYPNVSLNKSEVGVILNQNLFEGFGTKYDIQKQQARVDSAAFGIIETANQTTLRMSEVFIELYKQKRLLDLAKENILSHIEINNKIKDRMSSGVGTRSEVEESASRLALSLSNEAVLENNFNDAMSNFVRLYGSYIPVTDLEEPKSLDILPVNRKLAIEKSKIHNPSLKVQRANINVENNNAKLAEKEYYPQIDLEARKDWNYNTGGVEGRDDSSSIMLKLRYNLYNGGADKSNSEKSQKNIQKEKEVFSTLVRRVNESINLAWASYNALKKQIKYLKIHKELSQKTLDLFAEEFYLGRRTLLDILDTKEEVYSADRELVIAQYNAIYTQYRILEAVGTISSYFDNNFIQIIDINSNEYITFYNAPSPTIQDDIPMINSSEESLVLLAQELEKNDVVVEEKIVKENEELTLDSVMTIRFEVWSYDITKESEKELLKYIDFFKENNEYNIEINGYTDSKGKDSFNINRSLLRAEAVEKIMIKNGISKKRIIRNGYGNTNSIADNNTEEGRTLNRRVEVKLVH